MVAYGQMIRGVAKAERLATRRLRSRWSSCRVTGRASPANSRAGNGSAWRLAPRARQQAQGSAARRTARRAEISAARADAGRAQGAAEGAWHPPLSSSRTIRARPCRWPTGSPGVQRWQDSCRPETPEENLPAAPRRASWRISSVPPMCCRRSSPNGWVDPPNGRASGPNDIRPWRGWRREARVTGSSFLGNATPRDA